MRRCFLTIFCGFTIFSVYPQSGIENPALKLDLPVIDIPYQINTANIGGYNYFDSFTHPGMDTSLAVTSGIYSLFHFGMKAAEEWLGSDTYWKRFVINAALCVGDMLFFYLPSGYIWLHESFHRAGFTNAGVASHINYAYPAGAYTISDSGDIDYWPDLPRILAAGIEGEYLLIEKLQMNNFFYGQNLPNEFLYWLSNLQAWLYAYMPMQDDNLKMEVEGEEQDVSSDTLQWAYYLFNPNADISDDTVIKLSDLTDDGKLFLKNRVMMGLLNFASPMMFGIPSIPLSKNSDIYWNFAFRHYYTSFGTDTSLDVYLKNSSLRFKFALHNYINYENYFPAFEAVLLDWLVNINGLDIYVASNLMIGMQPYDQDFFTSRADFFGSARIRCDFAVSRHFMPYAEIIAKTDGWIAGNEALKKNISGKIGLAARF